MRATPASVAYYKVRTALYGLVWLCATSLVPATGLWLGWEDARDVYPWLPDLGWPGLLGTLVMGGTVIWFVALSVSLAPTGVQTHSESMLWPKATPR